MPVNRREFLQHSATAGTLLALSDPLALRAAESPNNKLVVGVMGVNGRGSSLASSFASLPGSSVAYVCDVDSRAVEKVSKLVEERGGTKPQGVTDFRKILDDNSVDALVIAAPDHWHAPAAILACSAKKHVYVEKPACHNPLEGEIMVQAARKNNRVVQLGTQRRSMPSVREAVAKVHEGAIGKVTFSRGWYNNARTSIGTGKTAPIPEWLTYDLWQGPAPERPYKDNMIHYNWHWFWDWGTGELGNNGIHALDICRMGLQVDYPLRVTSAGGRFCYQDDQQTPDTHVCTWEFKDKMLTWEGRSCQRRGFEGSMFGIAFYGDQGSIIIDGASWAMYDAKGKEMQTGKGSTTDREHILNFLDCIRTGERPNADIEEGYKSTLLCHLGNIAYRTGRTVNCDPSNGHILNDEQQQQLWSREYRKGWEPKA